MQLKPYKINVLVIFYYNKDYINKTWTCSRRYARDKL